MVPAVNDNRSTEEVFEGIDSAAEFKEQARISGDTVIRPACELDVSDFSFCCLLFPLNRRKHFYLLTNLGMPESIFKISLCLKHYIWSRL